MGAWLLGSSLLAWQVHQTLEYLKSRQATLKISKELMKDYYDVHFLEQDPGMIYVSYWPGTNME